MYNYNNYNSYNDFNYRPKRKKNKAFTYIAIVLVTSIISSVTVGGILYGKFTKALEEAELATLSKAEALTQIAIESAADENLQTIRKDLDAISGTDSGLSNTVLSTALVKGSTVTSIAKKAGPSIVGIRMTVAGTRRNFYGISNTSVGEGSGIIISKDGYVMTNYHVVSYADPKRGQSRNTVLEVFLPDGREAEAEFVGGDADTDLAVVRINLTNLPVAELGKSSDLEVGELAVAIGNPLGMEFAGSVTAGVISALNRTVNMGDKTMNLIQTDAAINEGNSGGALLNSQGQVIGINSAKIAASGVEGLGFAIPIDDARPIINQLITHGYVKGRAFIGISGIEITSAYSFLYDLPKGIYVTGVVSGSGAEKAGIRKGDVLISLDGKTLESLADMEAIKKAHKPGDTVKAVISRNGTKVTLDMTFSEEK